MLSQGNVNLRFVHLLASLGQTQKETQLIFTKLSRKTNSNLRSSTTRSQKVSRSKSAFLLLSQILYILQLMWRLMVNFNVGFGLFQQSKECRVLQHRKADLTCEEKRKQVLQQMKRKKAENGNTERYKIR